MEKRLDMMDIMDIYIYIYDWKWWVNDATLENHKDHFAVNMVSSKINNARGYKSEMIRETIYTEVKFHL